MNATIETYTTTTSTEITLNSDAEGFFENQSSSGEVEGDGALSPSVLNDIYLSLLAALPLSSKHRDHLLKRGLTDDEINKRMYGSLPTWRRDEIATKIANEYGSEKCKMVPGLIHRNGNWSLSGGPGTIVPVRDIKGLIYALKIRHDEVDQARSRYTYFSSKKQGGRGPRASIHVPLFPENKSPTFRITEGELKADISTVLDGIHTIALPGVNIWRAVANCLRQLGISSVRLAFDMDVFTNITVAKALANLSERLLGEGFDVEIETWDPQFKGIDDALLARTPIQIHRGQDANNILKNMLASAQVKVSSPTKDAPSNNESEKKRTESDKEKNENEQEPDDPLVEIAEGCVVTATLFHKVQSGEHMSHLERLRLAQIAIGAGLHNDAIAGYFRTQHNFNIEKTHANILSLRTGHRLASCKRISEDLGLCDGNCAAKRKVKGWSPNHLAAQGIKRKLPSIQVNSRNVRDVIKDAWKALHASNEPEPIIFNRLGSPVRLVDRIESLQIEMLGTVEMFGHLLRSANWYRIDKFGSPTFGKPDNQVASDMLVYADDRLPPLEFVITTPTYGHHGNLIAEPGYHIAEALFLDGKRMLEIPRVPEVPTDTEVKAAIKLLVEELLIDFPFVSEADRAHAIGALVLYFVRRLINGSTPLHGFEAPTPGSGKSLLAKLLSLIATGRFASATTMPTNDEEMRKKITSELMKGPQTFLFDNAPTATTIDSPSLAAVLTADPWSDRVLGVSKTISVPNQAVWILTGNNFKLSTELSRRYARSRLDPKQDKPWERDVEKFRHADIISWVKENRAELVRSVLLLVQAWISNGRPKPTIKPLGGFEQWSYVIGGILENVGIKGFLGNRNEIYEGADIEGQMWRELVGIWWEKFGKTPKTPSELNILCIQFELMTSVRGNGTERAQQTLLGKALLDAKDRVFGTYRLELDSDKGSHGKRYCLSRLPDHETTGTQTGSHSESNGTSDSYPLTGNLDDLKTPPQQSHSPKDGEGSPGSPSSPTRENDCALGGEPTPLDDLRGFSKKSSLSNYAAPLHLSSEEKGGK